MLIFGHIGLTTGIIKLCENTINNKRNAKNNNFIDYRMVVVGSILPDIIDKPIVEIVYGLQNHEGHFIAHSFIFSTLLIMLGIVIFRKRKNKSILLLGICSLIHQIFDKIMLLPNIFFLPKVNSVHFAILDRLEFLHIIMKPIYRVFPYLRGIIMYFEKPYVFISEMMGFIIIVYFAYKLYKNKEYESFLKCGRL